jgi:hypothetical protein
MGSFWADIFAPQLWKAATYVIRQVSPRKANDIIEATSPLLTGLIRSAAGELGDLAAKQVKADTLAKVLGIMTTEQNIASVVNAVHSGTHTLDVSQTAALSTYLESQLFGSKAVAKPVVGTGTTS